MDTLRQFPVRARAQLQTVYQRLHTFLRRDIWLFETFKRRYTPVFQSLAIRLLQIVLIVGRGFFLAHRCPLQAAALTFTTLLALVPMLAFMFAFLKGLGVQTLLERLLLEQLSVTSEDTVHLIINYVNNVKVGTLGVVGLGALLCTTILQLGVVEQIMNEIWGLHRGRSLVRRITDYVSVMVIAPVVVVLVLAINTTLQHQPLLTTLLEQRLIGDAMVLLFKLLRYVAVWCVFTFFYAFLPNARVKIIPALVGGMLGGTLWQITQWVYIEFQIGIINLQAIYGAFAQLPVLMLWIYTSWLVTLLGAEVTFACQNATTYSMERAMRSASVYVKEWLANALYFSLVRTFVAGTGPWSAQAFAQQHDIPMRLLHELLAILQDEHLLVEAATTPEHYVPGRHPDTITPWHILHALRHHGERAVEDIIAQHDARATTLITQVEDAMQQAAGARSVMQWLSDTDHTTDRSYGRRTS
jgi:membrane protein